MGAYTPFGPLYSVLNTMIQVCSSLNIYQSGAFEVGYKICCYGGLIISCTAVSDQPCFSTVSAILCELNLIVELQDLA